MFTSFRALRTGALALATSILILQGWGEAQTPTYHTYRSYPYAFSHPALGVRSADRFRNLPSYRASYVGFRAARTFTP